MPVLSTTMNVSVVHRSMVLKPTNPCALTLALAMLQRLAEGSITSASTRTQLSPPRI